MEDQPIEFGSVSRISAEHDAHIVGANAPRLENPTSSLQLVHPCQQPILSETKSSRAGIKPGILVRRRITVLISKVSER